MTRWARAACATSSRTPRSPRSPRPCAPPRPRGARSVSSTCSATAAAVGLWLDGDAGPVLADAGDAGPVLADAGDLRRALPRLPLVVLAACSASDPGELGSHLGSVAQALHRDGCDAVVSSRFPLSVPGSVVLTRHLYRGLLVELRSVEAALQRSRAALADDPSALDWAGLQLYARSDERGDTWPIVVRPYRGLLAFQPEHARLFFGREQKIAELRADLAALRAAACS